MKKIMIALTIMLTMAATGKAMSYEQARNEALFLTDKMAYELNLTDEQYEAAYEINLDYLMGVTSYDDVYGNYWERRNLDMSYVLLDWQWRTFCAASYFYRPLYWRDGFWHFGIYARYPHRDYFYFGRPVFYASYRGGHAWHVIGGRGYYYGRREHFRPVGRAHFGMLDRWNRGDFHHSRGPVTRYRDNYGGVRHSSTRTTVNRNSGSFTDRGSFHRNGTFHNGGVRSTNPRTGANGSYSGGGSFGGSHSGGGSFGGNHSGRTGGGSFGGSTSGRTGGGSFGGSTSGRIGGGSFGSGATRSMSSGSFGGAHRSSGGSQGGGHSSRGGAFSRGR